MPPLVLRSCCFVPFEKIPRAVEAAILSLALGATAPLCAQAEMAPATVISYPLAPGDVVQIDFLAQPAYGREMRVEADGQVDVPLIGPVRVAGRSIAEVRAELPVLLAGQVIRSRGGSGDELIPVRPEEVALKVAKYRPVYIDGAVRDPGEIAFDVGMTLREALAKARGIGVPTTRAATLNGTTETDLLAELAATLADKAVAQALLSGADELDTSALAALPIPQDRRESLITRAEARLAAEVKRQSLADRGDALLLKGAEDRIVDALRAKEGLLQIALNEETNVQRIEALARRGAASGDALTAGKRAWLQALDRVSAAQANAVEGQLSRRELEQANAEGQLKRRIELMTALDRLDTTEARLRDKLGYLLNPGVGATASGILIYRRGAVFDAAYDTPLMPGDTVAVPRAALQ
ncbi:polysaccharide export outer membrane protein [Rhodobacter aestuarii]|uniref:Polysaccharide export outer membrane protein n=1 Tax=Rhodobacter aestuarii TaxID=453582 RepID=A0A1N7MTL2_9RHOB|nr:polysaccharide biosynthesis/export family protein [Rhodobacter aestuarii]PTV96557.1 polysaccharide export outer membrane protein [Rhodobacter aestuarii]SIS89199.1 polysaccharide export outer membrane protein [Rhodobacter aestuarii]